MAKIEALLEITAKLRDPEEGCPWDLEQTFETIAPYTLEEAYEVDHAIRGGDMAELCDELGDLLFQVALHAQMAKEAEHFAFADVVSGICDKLVRRHPHIFGDPELGGERRVFADLEEQKQHWEESKARERGSGPKAEAGSDLLFEGIPRELPALARAAKLRKRLSGASPISRETPGTGDIAPEKLLPDEWDLTPFDAALSGVAEQIADAGARGGAEATRAVGALLSRVVELARDLGVDPEAALRDRNHEFEREVLRLRRLAPGGESK